MECIYCGSSENITREHIIPKTVFKGGNFQDQLIVLPSCKKCNSYFSKFEEKIFTQIKIVACNHQSIIDGVKKSLSREEAKGFGITIRNSFYDGNLSGEKRLMTTLDSNSLELVLEKIVKGIYYFEFGGVIRNFHSEIFILREDMKNMSEFQRKSIDIYDTIKDNLVSGKRKFPDYFEYKFIKEKNIVFFELKFYNDVNFGYFILFTD